MTEHKDDMSDAERRKLVGDRTAAILEAGGIVDVTDESDGAALFIVARLMRERRPRPDAEQGSES